MIENQCRKSFVTESDSLQPPRHAGYRVYGRFSPDPSTSREVMHALAPLTLVLSTAHQNDWLTRLIAERSLYYVTKVSSAVKNDAALAFLKLCNLIL